MSKTKDLINGLLVDVFNQILIIESETLKKMGVELSMTEVHVIEAISLVDVPTMGNVAKKLRVTLGTLTTSIDTLVKKGYVTRHKDESDRRRILLNLNEKSRNILQIHNNFHDDMIESALDDLNIEDDEVLLKSLENLYLYFKERY